MRWLRTSRSVGEPSDPYTPPHLIWQLPAPDGQPGGIVVGSDGQWRSAPTVRSGLRSRTPERLDVLAQIQWPEWVLPDSAA